MAKVRTPSTRTLDGGKTEVALGSSRASIYLVQNRESTLHEVTWYIAGKRHRKVFKDRQRAVEEAKLVVTKLDAADSQVLALSQQDRTTYLRALEILRPHKVGLVEAAKEYAAALSRLDGETLHAAISEYEKHSTRKLPKIRAGELVDRLLEARAQDGVSKLYLHDLRIRLGRFGKAFQTDIGGITTAELDAWLRQEGGAARTRANLRRLLVTLFKFGQAQGFLPKGKPTPADDLSAPRIAPSKIHIYSPEEMSKLLSEADDDLLPYFSFGAFTGLRTAEIQRLEWADVKWDQDVVVVNAEIAKTGQRRLVPILPPLRHWLGRCQGRAGHVLPKIKLLYRLGQTCTRAKIPWKKNALRHSFASYRLADIQNAAQVALEMGNSPAIIFSNYRELVTRQQAEAWWALAPLTKPRCEASRTDACAAALSLFSVLKPKVKTERRTPPSPTDQAYHYT